MDGPQKAWLSVLQIKAYPSLLTTEEVIFERSYATFGPTIDSSARVSYQPKQPYY
jgi:hypothetical protein